MDLEGKLIYHCRAGPLRVETKPLHMVASRDPLGSATASILCLYWATYPRESLYHELHDVEYIGETLVKVSDHGRLRSRCSI